MQTFRSLKFASNGTTRVETYLGRSWTVVPVVALVEGVLRPATSKAPEFVPAAVYEELPAAWNGRPVFISHPVVAGEYVDGNTPALIESAAVGLIFNAGLADSKLVMEAWLDHGRQTDVPELVSMLKRIEDKKPIEISVGAYVDMEDVSGEYDGEAYERQWKRLMPEHLALLQEGDEGACSRNMGCGVVAAKGAQPVSEKKASIFERLVGKLRAALSAEDMSDNDLKERIYKAVRQIDPNASWPDAVYAAKSEFVYCVYGPDYSSPLRMYRRSYTLSAEGQVAVGTEAVQVEPVLRYEPVAGQEPAVTAAVEAAAPPPCSCHEKNLRVQKEQQTMAASKSDLVKGLIEKGLFATEDQAFLENASEEQLAAFGTRLQTVEAPAAEVPVVAAAAAPKVVETPAAVSPAAPTFDALLEAADADTRYVIESGRASARDQRAKSIAALKASGRCQHTDAELQAMTLSALDKMVALVGAPKVDYRGVAAGPQTVETPKPVPAPPDMAAAIRKSQGLDK
jgi:hypothetical protein